ncbi:MAG: RNA 2'-phosphotransferase [Chloroflexales bacterium]|nr:RNA 2'-phosphotransferase [Chloroflexales bacterium]
MTNPQLIRISKTLSYHLRRRPNAIGLTLGPGGWVAVDDLLAALAHHGKPITHAELDEVVAWNPKQRFTFDPGGTRIRASQGHSVAVDLELAPVDPPATLYHGTGARTVASILREGLRKQQRHHVHLSADVATARAVGARHGRPVVIQVDAEAMRAAEHLLYRSANGVWLVDAVPPAFLQVQEESL